MAALPQQASRDTMPRLPLFGALALLVAAVLTVASARLSGYSPTQEIGDAQVLQTRMLRFADMPDGSVNVIDGTSNAVVASAGPGTNGFLRGALRGLMRVRKVDHVDYEALYRLEQLSNGQLMLTDTVTGMRLDLNAYGHTNAAVFGAFLSTTGDKS